MWPYNVCVRNVFINVQLPLLVRYVGVDPEYVHLPASEYLKVGKRIFGEHASGRGLFAKQDIPYYTSLALDENGKAFQIPPLTWSVIESLLTWAETNKVAIPFVEDELSTVHTFVEGVCQPFISKYDLCFIFISLPKYVHILYF